MTTNQGRAVWSHATGRIVLRDEDIIGSGGEGVVYEVQGHSTLVAKIYRRSRLTDEVVGKLEVMIEHPPATRDDLTGHLFVSWPLDTLHDTENENGPVIGFLMPKVEKTNNLIDYYNPHQRRRHARHANYRNLCAVARSLAVALNRIHGINYTFIVGDINESNAYITENEHVTLIDADSFQVTDNRTDPPTIHPCVVGKPEYTPPELQGERFDQIDRNQYHDRFALAVIIYQLLMEGTHPFRGRYTGQGEPPKVETNILNGHFLHSATADVPLYPMPHSPKWESLHEDIRELFLRCFDDGCINPQMRPAPSEWAETLDKTMGALVQCSVNASHWYFDGSTYASGNIDCPWCERYQTLRIDSFPYHAPPSPAQPAPQSDPPEPEPVQPISPPVAPVPEPRRRRLKAWQVVVGLPAIIIAAIWLINSVGGSAAAVPPVAAPPPQAPAPPAQAAPPVPPVPAAAPVVLPTNTPDAQATIEAQAQATAAIVAAVATSVQATAEAQPTATLVPPTNTPTATPTLRPTFTPSPTSTLTPTPAASPTATNAPVPTDTPTPSPTPTPVATATQTSTPIPISCSNVGPGANLSGCSLRGVNLLGVDLSNADLTYTDLRDAYLKDANLTGANLSYAQIGALSGVQGANLTNVDLSSVNLTGVLSFEKADLTRVRFAEGQDLSDVIFIRATLAHTVMRGATLQGANFQDASLYHTYLSGSDLTGATMSIFLTATKLTGAVLEGADLRGVNTRDETDIIYDQTTEFAGADMRGSKWPNRRYDSLANYDFSNANLRNADFRRSDLAGVIFDGADLREANFAGALLRRASFCNATLSDTDFRGADLTEARIRLEEVKTDDDTSLSGIRSCPD